MNCTELKPLLTAHALGDLAPETAARARAHLEECPACRALEQAVRATLDEVRDALRASAPGAARLDPARHAAILAARPRQRGRVLRWVTRRPGQLVRIAALLLVFAGLAGLLLPASMSSRARKAIVMPTASRWSDETFETERLEAPAVAVMVPKPEEDLAGADASKPNHGLSYDMQDAVVDFTDSRDVAGDRRAKAASPTALSVLAPRSTPAPAAQPAPADPASAPMATTRFRMLATPDATIAGHLTGVLPADGKVSASADTGLHRQIAPQTPAGERVTKETRRGNRATVQGQDAEPQDVRLGASLNLGFRDEKRAEPQTIADAPVVVASPVVMNGLAGGRLSLERNESAPIAPDAAREEAPDVRGIAGEENNGRFRGRIEQSEKSKFDAARLASSESEFKERKGETDDRSEVARPREPGMREAVALGWTSVHEQSAPVARGVAAAAPARPQPAKPDPRPIASARADMDVEGEPGIGGDTVTLDKLAQVNVLHAEGAARKPVSGPAAAESSVAPTRFQAWGVNQWVAAALDNHSTFAIDVDTASYTLTRRYLEQNRLPPPEAVRTEEFVNYFDYGYRAPEQATFAIYTEIAPSRFGHGRHLLKIGVKGRRVGREEQRGAALTILLDTSGSMEQPDRIGLAVAALRLLLDALDPRDRLALVQFDNQARLVLEHTPVTDKAGILTALESLRCGGATHLEAGLRKAYDVARQGFTPGAENRVIIISDGVANLGMESSSDLLELVAGQRGQGITCSIFGVGTGAYDDTMLEALADRGDGAYRYLDSLAEARRALVDDLGATLNTIARDVKIQVEFDARAVAQFRQLGYENRQLRHQDFRDDAVDAGEVGSGQTVTALYELELAPVATRGRAPLATVRVRYRRVDNGRVEEIALPVERTSVRASFEAAGPHFRLAACVAEFAEILRGSPHAEGADCGGVADALRPVTLELNLDPRVAEFQRLVHKAMGATWQGE